MWYAIIAKDHANSLEKRLASRSAHIERLKLLQDEGRLLLAGPFPAADSTDPGPAGYDGSLIIAEFSDLTAAEAWAAGDPYVSAGVYASVTAKPFRKTLPA
jgi:uncharacterized protein YciI